MAKNKNTAEKRNAASSKSAEKNTPPSSSKALSWLPVAAAGILLLGTWFLYQPALQNGFTNWDDNVYVTENQHIAWNSANRSEHLTKEVAGNFHPLTMWSLQADHHPLPGNRGIDPLPYHRTNVFLHLLNIALTFWLALRLGAGLWAAFFTALFFAIHPLHVESVAWVSGRKDVLFAAFFLGGLISWTYARNRQQTSDISLKYWVLALGFFILSCLSKPSAVVFPALLWLIDWRKNPDEAWSGKKWLQYAPFLLVSALFAWLTLRYQSEAGAVADQVVSLGRRLIFAAYGIVIYLWKMIFPTHLSAFHPAPDNNEPINGALYAAVPLALGAIGLTIWAFIRRKGWFFAAAFYGFNLILVLGILKVGSALFAERYTYLAYTGIFLTLSIALQQWSSGNSTRRLGVAAGAVFFAAVFAWQTREQIGVWKNSETLWSQIIGLYPDDNNYAYRGYYYFQNKQYDKALADFDRSFALNADNETVLHIRGVCLQKTNRHEEAVKLFSEYLAKYPPKAEVQLALAESLNSLHRKSEAIAYFEKGLAAKPDQLDAWNNLATAWFSEKNYVKAEESLTKALTLNPEYVPALNNRGACRLVTGRYREALSDFEKSLSINPNQPGIVDYKKRCTEKLGE